MQRATAVGGGSRAQKMWTGGGGGNDEQLMRDDDDRRLHSSNADSAALCVMCAGGTSRVALRCCVSATRGDAPESALARDDDRGLRRCD